jgi:AmiR/NasT family two-component response regulator
VLGFAHTVDHLNTALESRKAIGQAVGIVMERYAIDEDRAFDFLVRTSRDSNVKLRDIAADIVNGANRRNRLSGAAQPQDHAEVT